MTKEIFGQRLSRLRKEKDLTQNDIADRVGVTAQAVSKWENDQASPDIDILLALSDIFNISVDELLGKERSTGYVEEQSKKDIDKMIFKIVVKSAKGDNVNINLPFALIKVFINKDSGKIDLINGGNQALQDIDFRKLIELVEKGVVGELVTCESANGDKVSIRAE